MASHTAEQHKTEEQAKSKVTQTVKSAADAVDSKRDQVAHALDQAADTIGEKGRAIPDPGKGYSSAAKGKLHDAADYVRNNDAEAMGRDAYGAATTHPLATLVVFGAVIIGGGLIVASLVSEEGSGSSEGKQMARASVAQGLGPKGTEFVNRLRDAALSFATVKVTDAIEEMFPGFKEHFEKA